MSVITRARLHPSPRARFADIYRASPGNLHIRRREKTQRILQAFNSPTRRGVDKANNILA